MITRIVLAATVAAFAVTAVVAQGDPIGTRKGLMKEIGGANRNATEMLDGKQPFDVAKAKGVLTTMGGNATKMTTLFPDSSKSGDTAALPAVWDNKADFDAKMKKFSSDATAAAARVTDINSFRTEVGEVRKNCGGCHNTYRKKS
jgi:cytochrome c556